MSRGCNKISKHITGSRRTERSTTASFTGLTLLVNDIERSVDYYSKIPGTAILVNTPEFAMLRIGKNSRLGLLKSRGRKGFHLEFESKNLDALYTKLSSASSAHAKVSPGPPSERPWGERSFTMTDPDGYLVEFEDGKGSGK